MPEELINLRVFVASPGDVAEERGALQEVVNELNLTRGGNQDLHLELVRWETHAFPGIAAYSQEVINQQIGDNYDIFVGIMWTRFGTSTQVAGSGTEEEFNRAYGRYIQSPRDLRIMFYFKDAPIAPSQIDLDQLEKIRTFKDRIGEEGVLWWTYRQTDEFSRLLRLHLARELQDWGHGWGPSDGEAVGQESSGQSIVQQGQVGIVASIVQDNYADSILVSDAGFLDYLAIAHESFTRLEEISGRMTTAILDLGSKVEQRGAEITKVNSASGNDTRRIFLGRRVINHLVDDLNTFSATMEAEVPILAQNYKAAIDATTGAALLLSDFGDIDDSQVRPIINQLADLRGTFTTVRGQIEGFRMTIEAIPRMTAELNGARARSGRILGQLISEFDTAISLAAEAEKLLEDVLRSETTADKRETGTNSTVDDVDNENVENEDSSEDNG